MRNAFLSMMMAVALISCGGKDNKATTTETTTTTAKPAATAMTPEQDKGLDLIAKSDCLGCHKVADVGTGPAYVEVAKRYAGKPEMVDTLVQKIIKGGYGHWGTVPMTPHPQISEADAKAMVTYVLSVNAQ